MLLGLLTGLGGPAQAMPHTLRFDNLAASDLSTPPSSVSSLAQDRQGFIWIGTQNGAYRHDGQRSIIYHHADNDARSLPGDYVGAIFCDRQGRVWLGTNKGLARFNPQDESFTTFTPPAQAQAAQENEFVGRIIDDGKDGLWLATKHGLRHFDPASGRFDKYQHDPARPDSLASDQIAALARDARGGLWLSASADAIDYLAPGSHSFVHYLLNDPAHPDAKQGGATALCIDSAQQLWIGTASGIVLWRPDSAWSTRRTLAGPPEQRQFWVFGIYQDRNGTVWVGTQGSGLLRWDAGAQQFARYRHQQGDPHSLPSNHIYAMLLDRSDTLWLGTWGAGVTRTDLGSQGLGRFVPEAAMHDAALQDNVIDALSGAGPGRIWLGGPGGLRLFDTDSGAIVKTWRHDAARPASLSSNYVLALWQGAGAVLWIGTSEGLERLDTPDGALHKVRLGAAPNQAIRKIAPAHEGSLWLASEGGVLHYDPASGVVKPLAYDPGAAGGRANASVGVMLEDRRGRLWIGNPYGDGLDVRERGGAGWRHYRHQQGRADSLGNDFVRSLYEDGQGRVWVGTLKGLNLAQDGADGQLHFRAIGDAALSSVYIESIVDDQKGQLWAAGATASGASALIRIDPASGRAQYFYGSDGISGGDFYDGVAVRTRDGSLYFGTMQGLTTVRPDAVRSNTLAAQVAIVDLAVANRSLRALPRAPQVLLEGSVSEPRRLTLPWNDASFSVEFAAMHFADPARNRYAYRLDGLDTDWILSDAAHRTASYTNLAPGQYTLRVKASSKNGVWGEPGLSMAVTILPPLWATWWFRVLAALATLGALTLAYRWRILRLRATELTLSSLVTLRTAELHRTLLEQRALLDNALAGIAFQRHQVIERCNVSYERILGYEAGELLGQPTRIVFFSDKEYQNRARRLEQVLARGAPFVGERRYRRKDGSAVWCSANVKLIDVQHPEEGMVVVFQDITARKEAERALRQANRELTELSIGDGLTGIANRRRFDQVAEREWQRALRHQESLAVALFDVDHFKAYNDQYGHLAGDVCLRRVAQKLKEGLRRSGDFVARYGGEDFVIILPGQSAQEAGEVLEQLRRNIEALAMPHAASQAAPFITVSAGFAVTVPQQGASLAALLEQADQNLYHAKRHGRNQVLGAAPASALA